MQVRVFWLVFLRLCTLLFSVGTLACHIANIVLLKQYSSSHSTGSWWPGYVPYILYFVGPGVSTISGLALNFVSISSVSSIRGDRFLSVLNTALMIAVIVYNTLQSGIVPWTGGIAPGPSAPGKGFATYCSVYQDDKITFYRCWLTNGMWLGILVMVVFWILLGVFVLVQSTSDIYDDDDDDYNYKDDIPMAVSSPTTRNNVQGSPGFYHASTYREPAAVPAQANTGSGYNTPYSQTGYQEYDNYYDYPPQSATTYNPQLRADYATYDYGNGSPTHGPGGDYTHTQLQQQQYYASIPGANPGTPVVPSHKAYQ